MWKLELIILLSKWFKYWDQQVLGKKEVKKLRLRFFIEKPVD